MVAITVILAAVIGAFVLEIGDQQETAPSTSFDTEQSVQMYVSQWTGGGTPARANLTTVEIAHAGGETIAASQTQVKVNGNGSTYGSITNDDRTAPWELNYPEHWPVPDFVPALGTNKVVEFSSGETWRLHSVSAPEAPTAISHEQYRTAVEHPDCTLAMHFDPPKFHSDGFDDGSCPLSDDTRELVLLEQGDAIDVVWSATSGGKTQTLFTYTVQ
jgi:hypothetical protein